jgi:hypothetical protein
MQQHRERQQRHGLRLPVKFWRPGQESEGRVGYSLNISGGGLFVATRQPLPPNAVAEIEIGRPEGPLRVFARVMHAARYPGQFQAVFKSGMGLQFLQPEDPVLAGLVQQGQVLPDRGGRRRFYR